MGPQGPQAASGDAAQAVGWEGGGGGGVSQLGCPELSRNLRVQGGVGGEGPCSPSDLTCMVLSRGLLWPGSCCQLTTAGTAWQILPGSLSQPPHDAPPLQKKDTKKYL
ncbi:unnamed protein product [Pipistrellus nathusii]|uniref:Uncharacterized protein n=1 Tax=Pipistrellus nathusii TaxID=59473 RepID=A0ABP0A573_PIPNA